MRRLALVAAIFALLPAASAEAKPVARVQLDDCRQADPAAATFTGSMRAVPGTRRMAMRFLLLQRTGTKVFARVQAPGLAVWHRSAPGRRGFNWEQRLENLSPPTAYRTLVQFRWYDAGSKRIRSATRRSQVCGPSAPLPNLRVNSLTKRLGTSPGTAIYTVEIQNSGGSEAGAIDLVLRVDGSVIDAGRIERLGAGETRTLEYSGPDCRRSASVVLDPRNTSIEASEQDNERVLDCGPPLAR